MLISATIETIGSEKRAAPRRAARLKTTATTPDQNVEKVEIHDLSTTGFLMSAATHLSVGDQIKLHIADVVMNADVAWVSGAFVGCQFRQRLTKAQLSSALLKSEPMARPLPPEVERTLRHASEPLANVTRDSPLEGEQKYPVHVRVWTILLSSVALWAVLLKIFGVY